jgi:hypothetical protein
LILVGGTEANTMIVSWRPKGFEVSRLACRLAAAVLFTSLAVGCSDKGVTRLSPQTNSYLEGIPVPAKFELAEKMTEDYESGGQRTARHEYRGFFSDPASVREFYREQMPTLGWVRVSDQNVKGRVSLRFERKSEACTIEIEPGYLFQTTIRVIVNPFTRSTMEPPRRQMP